MIVWSLLGKQIMSILMGPAGKVILLALAFVGWTVYQRMDATSDCEATELRKELIESQRQLEIANRIAQDARARADQTENEIAETERLYNELVTDLKSIPTASCPIDPAIRERLLLIE